MAETVEILRMTHGRASLANLADGRVAFVEGGAPGDRVELGEEEDHGTYVSARATKILRAGDTRVDPPCPLVERCGGCPWQHLAPQAQLHAKEQNVRDCLERIGGIEEPSVRPIAASPQVVGYRNRIKLRHQDGRLGFYTARTHEIVEVDDCLIAEARVREALPETRTLLTQLRTEITRVEIAGRGLLDGCTLALNARGRRHDADNAVVERFLADGSRAGSGAVRGVYMWGRGWQQTWGDTSRRMSHDGAVYAESTAAAFGQVNSQANRIIVEHVLESVFTNAPEHGSALVIDLYAGAGNLSIPIASQKPALRVLSVDSDRAATRAGRAAATRQNIDNLEFATADARRFAAQRKPGNASHIVVNPPRSGLSRAARDIGSLQAPALTYVSCNPSTLARDIKTLAGTGYALEWAAPVDQFPHTFHVETVARLRLT